MDAKSRSHLPGLPVQSSVWAAVVPTGVSVERGYGSRGTTGVVGLDEVEEVTCVSAIDFELRPDNLALDTVRPNYNKPTTHINSWIGSRTCVLSCAPPQPGYRSDPLAYQRLASLRAEADQAVERAELAEGKCKKLEQEILSKDQDIQSLTHRLTNAEDQLDKAETNLKDAKSASADHESSKTTNESLQRKILLLEEELDGAEKNLKETVERCVNAADCCRPLADPHATHPPRLRQMDLKAEHYERQVQTLERDRDHWEKKHEVRRINQRLFFAYTPFVYRKSSRNIRSPRKSSTSSSPAWRGCDRVAISVFSSVCATSGSQYLSNVADAVCCSLVDLLRSTNSRKADDYSICILYDHFSGSMNNIHSHYFYARPCPLLIYSPWNFSDTELTQWRSSADSRDHDE